MGNVTPYLKRKSAAVTRMAEALRRLASKFQSLLRPFTGIAPVLPADQRDGWTPPAATPACLVILMTPVGPTTMPMLAQTRPVTLE